jgi:RNA polymerase sigma-70 factor, ECF subfamily
MSKSKNALPIPLLPPPGRESDKVLSDRVLIESIAARDESAMRTLYERYSACVFRFVTRIVKDEHLAEDITSEVFFEVWRQADTFESRSQVSTWVSAIVRFKAWSANRVRRHVSFDAAKAEQIEDITDSPEEALLKLDRRTKLRASLARMSPEHREIIDLIYYQEKTITEVAEVIQVPKNTVKTRMFYARKALRRLLVGAAERERGGRPHSAQGRASGNFSGKLPPDLRVVA